MDKATAVNPLLPRTADEKARARDRHVYREHVVCNTDARGHATAGNRSPFDLVVDATDGFIPLWARNSRLRWRFQEDSMNFFQDPAAAKTAIEQMFGEAVLSWGDAAPVRFVKRADAWDFEIVMAPADDCDNNGCVLAMAFFPDAGRHELLLYPKLFAQSRQEQVETLIHELGHVFGLRHFFAKITEKRWSSELFGEHSPFSIMNYGEHSVLTDYDRADLKRLYQLAWSGDLTEINGTPIRLMKPFHLL